MQRHRFNVHDEFKKESNTSATNISHGGNNNLDFEAGSTDFLRDRYWLTRVVLLRGLGFVYMVAFLVALNDNAALVSVLLLHSCNESYVQTHGSSPATVLRIRPDVQLENRAPNSHKIVIDSSCKTCGSLRSFFCAIPVHSRTVKVRSNLSTFIVEKKC